MPIRSGEYPKVTAFGSTDFGVGDELSAGGGPVAPIAMERRSDFKSDLLHFFRLAGDLGFDFQAHQLGFVSHVFSTHAFAEIKLHFTVSPSKCAFGGSFQAREGFDPLAMIHGPVIGVHGHIPLDLFEAQARTFEEPIVLD